jgi:hypothetical protein
MPNFQKGFLKVHDDISGHAEPGPGLDSGSSISGSDLGFKLDLTFELCHLNLQNSCP